MGAFRAMKPSLLLFDLDGTISDPLEGIARSINDALASLGYKVRPMSELGKYIGPPLDDAFIDITGSEDPSVINDLIVKFRERYAKIGYSENRLYPGVREVLQSLAEHDCPMGICTTKRRDFAEKILRRFGLRDYFQFISGGDVGVKKWRQIESLLAERVILQSALMIGDRAFDLTAAHKNRLNAAGVLWGYGSKAELEAEAPSCLLAQPADLLSFLP